MTTNVRTPNRSSPLPLWAQVLDDMKRRLGDGEFEHGFPAERELIQQYGVSRHTMRDAMRRLHAEGLINRERGRGTFLRRDTIKQQTGSLYSLFRSIEAQGFAPRSEVIELDRRVAPEIAAQLDVDPATEFVYLHRLRRANDTPIATDELWLVASIAAPLLEVDFANTAVYSALEQRCGVRPGAGWERVHPVIPSKLERAMLGLSAQQPAFLVERLTHAGELPLEWRRTIIRGDRYTFFSSWSHTGEAVEEAAFSPTS